MCWERCRKTQVARGWAASAGHHLGEPGGGCSQRGRMERGGRAQPGGEERTKSVEGEHISLCTQAHRQPELWAVRDPARGNGPAA